jgi:hypothetical protein
MLVRKAVDLAKVRASCQAMSQSSGWLVSIFWTKNKLNTKNTTKITTFFYQKTSKMVYKAVRSAIVVLRKPTALEIPCQFTQDVPLLQNPFLIVQTFQWN